MAEQPGPWQATSVTLAGRDGAPFRGVEVIPAQATAAPVIMLHGMFTDRRFWLADKGVGLAAHLAEHGHPVFIVQRRGLSDSPATGKRSGLDEHLRHDLPVVQQHVAERFNTPAFWLGHSFGGVTAARAVAETLDPGRVAGLILLASQFEVGKHMLDWPGSIITRALVRTCGHLPARAVGLGPVNEPAAAAHDACDWVTRGRRKPDIRRALGNITVPILVVSGAADRVDPTTGCRQLVAYTQSRDVTFIRAGRRERFSQDYDHPGIVISKAAQREIWPLIRDWLAKRGH